MKFIQMCQSFFPFFFFFNNFRFTAHKYITFGYPKVHRSTYLIVISIDDLAPNRPQIRIWYGILTWINQFAAIDLNMLARICRQQCILFIFVTFRFFDRSLSFWCKVYHASVFLCCKFERDRWSQRSTSRQKLLEASGRVGAILTTVASCGCPQCLGCRNADDASWYTW